MTTSSSPRRARWLLRLSGAAALSALVGGCAAGPTYVLERASAPLFADAGQLLVFRQGGALAGGRGPDALEVHTVSAEGLSPGASWGVEGRNQRLQSLSWVRDRAQVLARYEGGAELRAWPGGKQLAYSKGEVFDLRPDGRFALRAFRDGLLSVDDLADRARSSGYAPPPGVFATSAGPKSLVDIIREAKGEPLSGEALAAFERLTADALLGKAEPPQRAPVVAPAAKGVEDAEEAPQAEAPQADEYDAAAGGAEEPGEGEDPSEGAEPAEPPAPPAITRARFLPDGRLAFSHRQAGPGGTERGGRVWLARVPKGRDLDTLWVEPSFLRGLVPLSGGTNFALRGGRLFALDDNRGLIAYELETGALVWSVDLVAQLWEGAELSPGEGLRDVACNSDGTKLAVWGRGRFAVLEAATGKVVHSFPVGVPKAERRVDFRDLACAQGYVAVYEAVAGEALVYQFGRYEPYARQPLQAGAVLSGFSLSGDGAWLALGLGESVQIWRVTPAE